MSTQFGKLCALILQETFGDIVQKVGHDLFMCGPKPIPLIAFTTKLSVDKIKQSLNVLIHHNLVTFLQGKKPGSVEYELHSERILYMLRYPRYLFLMKTLHRDEAEMLLEELLRQGQETSSRLIFRATRRLIDTLGENKSVSPVMLREKFNILVLNQFIQRCPVCVKGDDENSIPTFLVQEDLLYQVPEINIQDLTSKLQNKEEMLGTQPDDDIYWRINYQRFHQEFRDQVMVSAVARRIDKHAGDLMKIMIQLMYCKTDAWAPTSGSITMTELRDAVKKQSGNPVLYQYLEQYIKVIVEDSNQFVHKVGEAGGGEYSINIKNTYIQLTWATLENIVLERFGSKAARIFRLVKMKNYVEQEWLQELGMIPAKEAKLLSYQLLQENFLQLQELRKSLANNGPNKTFFLFHIDLNQVVHLVQEMCFKALYNAIMRREHETVENRRLLEKQQRIDSIALNMKEQGATEEQLGEIEEMLTPPERALLEKAQATTDKLGQAELQIDETIFLMQMCLYYQQQKTY